MLTENFFAKGGEKNSDRDFSQNKALISRSQVKKDYLKKDFANPYFVKNKKPAGFNTKFYLKIFFIILIIYILIYSDLFKIKNLAIQGTEMIRPEELTALINNKLNTRRWFLIPRRNLFFYDKSDLQKAIKAKYNLSALEIKRGWQSLTIKIKEKISYLIVYNLGDQRFYLADMAGAVDEEIPKEGIAEFWQRFPILNINNQEIKIGENIITAKMVNYILDLDKNLKSQPFNIQGYEKEGIDEVSAVMKEGWRARFDVNSNIKDSVENLLLVYNKIDKSKTIEYIDLRFGNKVFYK
ncbi:MAG: cell division protein FtsQ/DivIB [Patescibacteria group bacterium]